MATFDTLYPAATVLTGGSILGSQGGQTKHFPANLLVAGSFVVTNQATAEAGVNNTEGMTPLRTKQAILEQAVVELDVFPDVDEIVVTGSNGQGFVLPLATEEAAGLMAPEEKAHLNLRGAMEIITEPNSTRTLTAADHNKCFLCTHVDGCLVTFGTGEMAINMHVAFMQRSAEPVVFVTSSTTLELPPNASAETRGVNCLVGILFESSTKGTLFGDLAL